MPGYDPQRTREIVQPTLEAIDLLRVALDRAMETRDEIAIRFLKHLISEAFATVHAIEGDKRKQ